MTSHCKRCGGELHRIIYRTRYAGWQVPGVHRCTRCGLDWPYEQQDQKQEPVQIVPPPVDPLPVRVAPQKLDGQISWDF